MLKTEIVQVPADWAESRDKGKRFLLTEMTATRAEKWGVRAGLALTRGGVELPQNIQGIGAVGVMILFLNSLLRGNVQFSDLEPLLDEMMTCVSLVYDPQRPDLTRPLIEDDIVDVKTRLWLRSEVFRLHTNFTAAEALSGLISAAMTPPV